MSPVLIVNGLCSFCVYFYCYFLSQNADMPQHAIVKAQKAVDHPTSFLSSKEEISQPGIKPPTSSLIIIY
jgi:hypothetical protein